MFFSKKHIFAFFPPDLSPVGFSDSFALWSLHASAFWLPAYGSSLMMRKSFLLNINQVQNQNRTICTNTGSKTGCTEFGEGKYNISFWRDFILLGNVHHGQFPHCALCIEPTHHAWHILAIGSLSLLSTYFPFEEGRNMKSHFPDSLAAGSGCELGTAFRRMCANLQHRYKMFKSEVTIFL